MRIISWNLNGIRAAIRKGLASFMERLDGDVWLFQEIRARPDQLSDEWAHPKAHVTWHPAERQGTLGLRLGPRPNMTSSDAGCPRSIWVIPRGDCSSPSMGTSPS